MQVSSTFGSGVIVLKEASSLWFLPTQHVNFFKMILQANCRKRSLVKPNPTPKKTPRVRSAKAAPGKSGVKTKLDAATPTKTNIRLAVDEGAIEE